MKKIAAVVALAFIVFLPPAWGGEKKVTGKIEQKDQMLEMANAMRALRAEVLNWQKKYHMERYTNMQLRAINSLCITQEFVENQQAILDLQKKIQQQQLIGGQIK